MPLRGAWLEYETDGNDIFWVRVDRTRKVPVTTLLRAIGLVSDSQILELFGDEEMLKATINKDTIKDQDEALIEIYKKLRPGELPTADAARNLFNGLFYDNRRYDLAKVGRYKYNQKLGLAGRIKNKISADDIVDSETGEVFVSAGEMITEEVAENIQNAGINSVDIMVGEKRVRIIGNATCNIHAILPNVDLSKLHFKENVNYNVLKNIIDNTDEKDLAKIIEERYDELVPKHITTEDMIASINYLLNLSHGLGKADDIDPSAFDNGIDDDTFAKIVACIRIATPYTGMIISTRESQECRKRLLSLGISQMSGGSKTSVGGYFKPMPDTENSSQFDISDKRPLDDVIKWLMELGYLPSFCTACYRAGRTGERFMEVCKDRQIHNFCHPNAIITLKEYLEDYASAETKAIGEKFIKHEMEILESGETIKTAVEKDLVKIEAGERDFRF